MNRLRLTIDQGNTCLKATLFRTAEKGPQIADTLKVENARGGKLLDWVGEHTPQSGIIACTGTLDDTLAQSLQTLLPGGCLTLTAETSLPIGLRYDTPHTLGPDRIADAAGASLLFPGSAALIADAGTCLTLDLLAADCFLGGNISPGLQMRLQAMHAFTASLPLLHTGDLPSELPRFGTDTLSAMSAGALGGMISEIQTLYLHTQELHPGALLLLTGGDAQTLLPHLQARGLNPCLVPSLAHLGLYSILRHNERI